MSSPQLPSRLSMLRRDLDRLGVDALLVPRADEHLGEYVPARAERLAYLSGFTGSAGLAVVSRDRAALFVDGRYTEQAAEQADPAAWELRHLIESPPQAWLRDVSPGGRVGYDPWLHSEDALARYRYAGLAMVPLASNPVDAIWTDQPPPPAHPAVPHPLSAAGRTSAEKRSELAGTLRQAGQHLAVITDPASLCWLLNIRGGDVPFTPFVLCFALLHDDARVELFVAPGKVDAALAEWLGPEVRVADRATLPDALAALAGRRVRADPAGSPAWFAETLREAGAEPVPGADPCLLAKACKNPVEQRGARAAQRRDAVALCRFLHWLHHAAPSGDQTELSAAAELLALRARAPEFRGESFPAISAAGEHAALPHYRVSEASNHPIRPNQIYLIDSGGQYEDGTTDITRTVWIGPDAPPDRVRDRYTRVLKGHVAVARLVFPRGCAGAHLDGFARHALWQAGLDFDHGTGHGVGSYLSVHEGPVSLSRAAKPVPLAEGMILSDEPGFYLPGQWGIRLENLLLVQPAELPEATKPFLRFETLSLAPFDRRLILPDLLDAGERAWLDAYHARVMQEIGPALEPDAAEWLGAQCLPLGGSSAFTKA